MLLTLEETIKGIRAADAAYTDAAWAHWDSLCKPLRGFGALETMVARMAGMQRTTTPSADRRAIVIMGADNGVVAEGVSQTGSEVTAQVLENMGNHITSICVMSDLLHADVFPVNIGMNRDASHPKVINAAVRHGTGNIAAEPAMTRDECVRAVEIGINTAARLHEEGYSILLAGEMGIGNTTTSAACACVMFDVDAQTVTGRGAGLSTEGLVRKTDVVRRAIALHHPDASDPLDVISKVGGLDIAGMTGLYLGAAFCRMPVMIDGVISGISAVAAVMLQPLCRDYMLATHCTAEPAGKLIFERLGLEPVLYADMHLGEATGAAAVLPVLDLALHAYNTLPGFDGGKVEQYRHLK